MDGLKQLSMMLLPKHPSSQFQESQETCGVMEMKFILNSVFIDIMVIGIQLMLPSVTGKSLQNN